MADLLTRARHHAAQHRLQGHEALAQLLDDLDTPHQLAELAETQRQVNTVRAEQVAIAKRPPDEQRAALRTISERTA